MSDMSFTWKGKSSAEMGVVVRRLPPQSIPQRRSEEHTVPGRSGFLHIEDGAYEEVIKPIECYLPYEQGTPIKPLSEIRAWLTGTDWLMVSNVPYRKYKATILSAVQFDAWVPGFGDLIFAVYFNAYPYGYHVPTPANYVWGSGGGNANNPGTAESEPTITISGNGNITLMVGQQIVTLDGVVGSITLNSELKEAYSGNTLENRKMTGEFPLLYPGGNPVSASGSVTGITVAPNWRDIG